MLGLSVFESDQTFGAVATQYGFGGEGLPTRFGGFSASAFANELRGLGFGVSNIVVSQSPSGGGRQTFSGKITLGAGWSSFDLETRIKNYFKFYYSDLRAWWWQSTANPLPTATTPSPAASAPTSTRQVVFEVSGAFTTIGLSGALAILFPPAIVVQNQDASGSIKSMLQSKGWSIQNVSRSRLVGLTHYYRVTASVGTQFSEWDVVNNATNDLAAVMSNVRVAIISQSVPIVDRSPAGQNDSSARLGSNDFLGSLGINSLMAGLGISTPIAIVGGGLLLILLLRR